MLGYNEDIIIDYSEKNKECKRLAAENTALKKQLKKANKSKDSPKAKKTKVYIFFIVVFTILFVASIILMQHGEIILMQHGEIIMLFIGFLLMFVSLAIDIYLIFVLLSNISDGED